MSQAPIDLRSDIVIRSTEAMCATMAAAPVGDDQYGEDPTTNRLQARCAELLGQGQTDKDGRLRDLLPPGPAAQGRYRLTFATGAYFQAQGAPVFYPEVRVDFQIGDTTHYHVPLLLSPFGYSTYRGS